MRKEEIKCLRYLNSIDLVSMAGNCLIQQLCAYPQSLDPMAQHRSMALCILRQCHPILFADTLPTWSVQMNRHRHVAMTRSNLNLCYFWNGKKWNVKNIVDLKRTGNGIWINVKITFDREFRVPYNVWYRPVYLCPNPMADLVYSLRPIQNRQSHMCHSHVPKYFSTLNHDVQ